MKGGILLACIFASLFRKAPLEVQQTDKSMKIVEDFAIHSYQLQSLGVGGIYKEKIISFYGDFIAHYPMNTTKAKKILVSLRETCQYQLKKNQELVAKLTIPIDHDHISLSLAYTTPKGKKKEAVLTGEQIKISLQ